jgi:tetratricopeptide (TPR) repeat protein
MLKIEVNSRKKLLRTTISTLISTSFLVGCGPLTQKPVTASNASNSTSEKPGFCYNGGRVNEYSCDPDKAAPQADMRITEVDDAWMSEKLAEVRTWMEQEKKAILNGKSSSATAAGTTQHVTSATLAESKDFISTVSIATPTPQHTSPELASILRLSQQGQHKKALTRINKVIADNPNMASAELTKGIISSNMGDKPAAKMIFQRLMKKYPDRPEAFNNLAVIYSEEGNFPQAIETLQQAFKTHPSYAQVHTNLKELYATLASQAYNKALDLGSNSTNPELVMINRVPANLSGNGSDKLLVVNKPIQLASNNAKVATVKVESTEVETPTAPQVNAKKEVEVVSLVAQPISTTNTATTTEATPSQIASTTSSKVKQDIEPVQTSTAALSDEQKIELNLTNWASAWSNKNHQGYIAAYTDMYRPNAKLSHSQWVEQRQQRITKPNFIRVSVSQINVKLLRDNLAEAHFEQRYQSDTYKDAVRKRMVLVKSDGQWKISLEKSLGLIR